jgi:hypothetical protein
MDVVSAGMHHAVDLGSVGNRVLLLDLQPVEVGPKADDGRLGADIGVEADAVGANFGSDANGLECLGDPVGGSALGPTELGVGVKVSAQLHGRWSNARCLALDCCHSVGHGGRVYGECHRCDSALRAPGRGRDAACSSLWARYSR